MSHGKWILILLLLSLVSCDRFTTISGRIVDDKSQPISGVTIALRRSITQPVKSENDGKFSITAAHWGEPSFTIIAEKEGYKRYSKQLPPANNNPGTDFILRIEMQRK